MKVAFQYHITKVSSNKKTGPIPVTTTSKDSCPNHCPYKGNGCYAESGPLNIHWNKITKRERGIDFAEFISEIKSLRKGQLWRHNQAGDLPHHNGEIDTSAMTKLINANKGKRGFTYTHHNPLTNINILRKANENGFTVNISGNNVDHAVKLYKETGLPTVTVLPIDAPNVQVVENTKIVACPAEKSDKVNCANCGLCAINDRDYIIGFRAHGTSKKKANKIAAMNI